MIGTTPLAAPTLAMPVDSAPGSVSDSTPQSHLGKRLSWAPSCAQGADAVMTPMAAVTAKKYLYRLTQKQPSWIAPKDTSLVSQISDFAFKVNHAVCQWLQIEPAVPVVASRNGEISLAQQIARHPAARCAVSALLGSAIDLVTRVYGEMEGALKIIQAVSPAIESQPNGRASVVSAQFTSVGSVGWNGINILKVRQSGDFREQCTQFDTLVNSPMFKDLLVEIATRPDLSEKCQDLVYLPFLRQAYEQNSDNLYRYSSDFKLAQDQSRQPPPNGVAPYAVDSAASLVDTRGLTVNQLKYHLQNPINGASPATVLHPAKTVRDFAAINHINLAEVKVVSDYGDAAWVPVETSDFVQKSHFAGLPVAAGPSGTTNRFMMAGRLLAPGGQRKLGLPPAQDGARPADRLAYLELMRFALYGFLVADRHHSFSEVNAGAAEHGLAPQCGREIYSAPFSADISGRDFDCGNQDLARLAPVLSVPSPA